MKRVTLPLWGLVALAVMLWGLSRWDAAVTRQDSAFVEQATRALEAGKAFRTRAERLANASRMAQNRAVAALGRSDSLSRTLLSLQAAFPDSGAIPRTTVDSLLDLAERRDSLRLVAIHGLTLAVEAERQRALAAEARVETLEKVVAQGIKVVDCRILGLPFAPRCPSRTASFGIGAGAGALAVLLDR